jgi:hypothetical protein
MSLENKLSIRPHAAKLPLAERPPIFDERNRAVWDAVRRLMIYILKELDKWYGWKTFE